MKFGLKLWSTDTGLAKEVVPLFEKGTTSFLELYVVPGSFKETVRVWSSLKIPWIIHAPHFGHGFNLSLKENFDRNAILFNEAKEFCDRLKAKHILLHLGTRGSLEEAMEQIDRFDSSNVVIENKPQVALDGTRCVGASPEEIKAVLEKCGTGFCCDLSHAIKFAAFHGFDSISVLKKFLDLNPCQYHLCDGFVKNFRDEHLNIGQGEYDFETILSLLPKESEVTLETPKKSPEPLASFTAEVSRLRDLLP